MRMEITIELIISNFFQVSLSGHWVGKGRWLEESEEMAAMKLEDSFKKGRRGTRAIRREYIFYKFRQKDKIA